MVKVSHDIEVKVIELADKKKSYGYIAAKTGLSVNTVTSILYRLGYVYRDQVANKGPVTVQCKTGRTIRRFTDTEDTELQRLANEGLTFTEIGRVTDRRRNAVRARLLTLARYEEWKVEGQHHDR